MPPPRVRSDIVDVYVFRRTPFGPGGSELLLLRRARGMLPGAWHPVMGHLRAHETAVGCARRELEEEVALTPGSPQLVTLWQLEQVHPYFLADRNEIVLSPRFAAEVAPAWEPVLSAEHSAWRWIDTDGAHELMWPGQRAALAEIRSELLPAHSKSRTALRIPPTAR